MVRHRTPSEFLAANDTTIDSATEPQESLADLYRRYAVWLRSHLRRRFGIDGEDIVQETYIRLAPFHAAREIRHPRALLMRVAGNLARNQLRAEAGRKRLADTLEREAADVGGASAPDQLEGLLFKQAVLSLPPIFRDVMILSRFTGLTNAEIAARLDLSIKTVEWRLTKAIVLCAKQLAD